MIILPHRSVGVLTSPQRAKTATVTPRPLFSISIQKMPLWPTVPLPYPTSTWIWTNKISKTPSIMICQLAICPYLARKSLLAGMMTYSVIEIIPLLLDKMKILHLNVAQIFQKPKATWWRSLRVRHFQWIPLKFMEAAPYREKSQTAAMRTVSRMMSWLTITGLKINTKSPRKKIS